MKIIGGIEKSDKLILKLTRLKISFILLRNHTARRLVPIFQRRSCKQDHYSLVVQFSKIKHSICCVFPRHRNFSGDFYNISCSSLLCKHFFSIHFQSLYSALVSVNFSLEKERKLIYHIEQKRSTLFRQIVSYPFSKPPILPIP